MDTAHYNKMEKGLVQPFIDVLDIMAAFYGITIDQIVHLGKDVQQAVQIKDKAVAEQLPFIAQLNKKDRGIVLSNIDTMLTKQKFQQFFQQNIAAQ